MSRGNRPRAPLFATVNVTTRCNLDCTYCYMQPRTGLDMPRADFERVVDTLSEQGVFLLTLSGGEPFLHPEFSALFLHAHRRFQHVMTLTNGTATGSAHLEAIRKVLDEKGSVSVQVSLDAVESRVNAQTRSGSARTIGTIETLAAMGCHVIVAIVVTRHNLARVVPTIEALADRTRWFHLMTVQDVRARRGLGAALEADAAGRASLWQEVRALATARGLAVNFPNRDCDPGCAKGAPCMAAFSHLAIDPDLGVRPCDRMTDVVLGNLGQSTLDEIWQGPKARAVLRGPEPACRSTAFGAAPQAGRPALTPAPC